MIVRRRHNGRFAALPNAIWTDERLSIEAKGVLGYLLSRPHNWNVRLPQIGRVLNVGKDRLQRIFRQLIEAGYVTREQRRTEGGVFGSAEYIVRDEPEDSVASLPQPDLPEPVKPEPVEPAPENTAAYKDREELNTDFTKPLSPTPCPNAPPSPRLAKKGLGDERAGSRSEHASIVQARVASRLGRGNVAEGWTRFGALSDTKRDELTAQERNGRLSDTVVAEVLLSLSAM
jgi:hypothetical protein